VQIFEKNESTHKWHAVQTLVASGGGSESNSRFGRTSISVFGKEIGVGCGECSSKRGAVFIFRHDESNGTWGTGKKIEV